MAVPPPPPPPGGGGGGGGGGDLDLQAVDNIPRDTLVALLKRKDKEAKGLAAKLEKLEERYIKVVRFNKILMEDRSSFQRFCGELLVESDGTFEEAAAQETPVNLDALLRQLSEWRGALERASEDRKVFQQFTELVFPGDATVEQLFKGNSLGSDAFDTLQVQWTALEDLHNQSIASVNAMSREQIMARGSEIEEARQAQKEAERKAEDMKEQLTKLHREKAQMLTQRFHGQSGAADRDGASGGAAASFVDAGSAAGAEAGGQVRELRQALDASERRERETRDYALRREQDLQGMVDTQRTEVQRLKREIERINADGERHRVKAQQMCEDKDAILDRMKAKLSDLEQELGSNAFIAQLAEQQAGRDAEVRAKQRQVEGLNQSFEEIQRSLNLSYSQERVLKDRIRELESSHCRGHVAGDYLKHVVMKYMEYTQAGDLKAQGLVPVLCTLLSLSPEERRSVESPCVPQPLLLLNQAIGGANAWLRGGASPGGGGGVGGSPPASNELLEAA